MSGQELSNYSMGDKPTDFRSAETFLSAYEVDLADKLTLFRQNLENDRTADVISHCFTFQGDCLENIYLPKQVEQLTRRHGRLNKTVIECAFLDNCGGSSFEMRMEFSDGDSQNSAWLTVARPYNYSSISSSEDVVIIQNKDNATQSVGEYKINAFTNQEFNRCLGSLVYSSPLIQQSVFDQFDWHKENYALMTENFKHVAEKTWSNHEYILTDDTGGYAGSLSYYHMGDDLSEIRLSRVTNLNASVYGNSLRFEEKTVELSLPLAKGSMIELFEHSFVDGASNTQLCIPVESDYLMAIDFIKDQLKQIRSVPLEQFDDESTQPFDDF